MTRPGDLVLIAPGAVQHYRASPDSGPWGYWSAHFQPRAAWFAWPRLPEVSPGFSLTRLDVPGRGERLHGARVRRITGVHRIHRRGAAQPRPRGVHPVRAAAPHDRP
ncbi:AraC family ligand binding domain-containing protein, partial [Actinoallomurus acaciae]